MLRNSFFPCRLCLLVTGLAAMIAVAPTSQAVDWLGKAYENHMEFSVMSRSYETSIGGGQPKRYVLLNARPGGPIVRPRPLTLPDGEVLAIAHGALTQAGFVAAGSAAEAEIAFARDGIQSREESIARKQQEREEAAVALAQIDP
jgi:hypothetical protein